METETTIENEKEKKASLYDVFYELSCAEEKIKDLEAELAEQNAKRDATIAAALPLMRDGSPYVYMRSYTQYVIVRTGDEIKTVVAEKIGY